MRQIKHKIKKLGPLIKKRNERLTQERLKLSEIRKKRDLLKSRLDEVQANYLNGVDHLNQLRGQGQFQLLQGLEYSLSATKNEWGKTLSELRNSENEYIQQNRVCIEAQKRLISLENLRDKYKKESMRIATFKENKELDEMALVRHHINKKEWGSA